MAVRGMPVRTVFSHETYGKLEELAGNFGLNVQDTVKMIVSQWLAASDRSSEARDER